MWWWWTTARTRRSGRIRARVHIPTWTPTRVATGSALAASGDDGRRLPISSVGRPFSFQEGRSRSAVLAPSSLKKQNHECLTTTYVPMQAPPPPAARRSELDGAESAIGRPARHL
ncbi:hypothetical protein GGS23DRAFT_113416 [Durotheca rogersii]|uniref:uncharacterized protein n=1 Tax=Durotheca rogersii TaxID=419775 RepID=UPI00221F2881|nr:uncharacterized protein GGS23DRAFT_113416 [Durotheca rogersii]KAI5862241.1 hypothetical protein GGS23DRAFT_113416 [Durotheca rogersii]